MNVERFAVPELLFHPSDIGIEQMGLAEAVVCAVDRCPPETRRWLYANVVLTGGCMMLPNIRERILRDVRELAPQQYQVSQRVIILMKIFKKV